MTDEQRERLRHAQIIEGIMRVRPDTEPGYEEDGLGNWRIVYPDGRATYPVDGEARWGKIR